MFINKFVKVFSPALKWILFNNLLNVSIKFTMSLDGVKGFLCIVFKDTVCYLKAIFILWKADKQVQKCKKSTEFHMFKLGEEIVNYSGISVYVATFDYCEVKHIKPSRSNNYTGWLFVNHPMAEILKNPTDDTKPQSWHLCEIQMITIISLWALRMSIIGFVSMSEEALLIAL